MSNKIVEVKSALYHQPVTDAARGAEPVERLIRIFEQLPQNYQMVILTMSTVGLIGVSIYAIHRGYSVTKKENGWSLSPVSSVA